MLNVWLLVASYYRHKHQQYYSWGSVSISIINPQLKRENDLQSQTWHKRRLQDFPHCNKKIFMTKINSVFISYRQENGFTGFIGKKASYFVQWIWQVILVQHRNHAKSLYNYSTVKNDFHTIKSQTNGSIGKQRRFY